MDLLPVDYTVSLRMMFISIISASKKLGAAKVWITPSEGGAGSLVCVESEMGVHPLPVCEYQFELMNLSTDNPESVVTVCLSPGIIDKEWLQWLPNQQKSLLDATQR